MLILAPIDCRSENICILPVVIAELEFGNIKRRIFPAHFVERADNTALEYRPEAFDGLSVDCTNNILAIGTVNNGVWIISEVLIANPLIGAEQTYLVRDCLAHEGFQLAA